MRHDTEKAQIEDGALSEATRFFNDLTPKEREWLQDLTAYAAETYSKNGKKLRN